MVDEYEEIDSEVLEAINVQIPLWSMNTNYYSCYYVCI